MRRRHFSLMIIIAIAISPLVQAAVVDNLLEQYTTEGASEFSAARGETMWQQSHTDPKGGKPRSCTTCHGKDLRSKGKHARTGKIIEPMSPTVNNKRLTDPKHIRKWFRRNCKWVLGRECTPQEKGDFLLFLRSQ